MMKLAIPIGLLLAAIGSPVPAQENRPCELHVIPTASFRVVDGTQSFVTNGGGGMVGSAMGALMAIRNPKVIEQFIASTLPAEQQQEILKNLDLNKILKLQNYSVNFHEVIDDIEAKKIMEDDNIEQSQRVKKFFNHTQFGPRLTSSRSTCYAELRVNSIYYEKSPMSKRLYAVFVFRKFALEQVPVFSAGRQIGEPLSSFPPENEDERTAAKIQLRQAFANTLHGFAAKMIK